IKAIPVGDYVAKVWACDSVGNTYDGVAEEKDFSISQPHVNVGFISELNAKGEWTISAVGSPVDLKQISLHPCDILNRPILNTTIEFRNQLDKSKVYAIVFDGKELVSKIKCPADINSPKPSYSNLSACSGKTVKCTYTFDEELSFEASSNSQKSKSHVVQATSKSLSFDAVRHSYTVNKTTLLGSSASWMEIVTKTISDNNVPYVEKPSINWDDAIIKYNLDCYEQSTPILDLKGINGGSNSLTYSCDVYLHNSLLQSVIVKNKGNNLSNTISFDKAGDYTLMITNNGYCPNDVLQTTITISQPDPLTFDYAVTDELCQGAKNGSIQISNVNGGNYGESFSYALAWEWTHNDFFKSWYSEGSIDKIGEYLSDRHKNGLFGRYEVTVYDENKCSKTERIYVNRYYNPLVKEAIVDSVNCAGGSDGAITLNKIQTNGTFYKKHGSKNGNEYSEGEEYVSLASLVCAPYVDSLELSPLPVKSLKEVENLSAGTYNLHLTDSKGCESVATYTVYEPEKMKLNFLEDNLNLRIPKKGSTGGAVSLQVSGGNENSGYTLFVNDEPIGDMKLNTPKNLKNSFLAQDYFFYCKDNYHSCMSDSVHLSFTEPDEDLSFKKWVSNAKCKAEVGSIKISPSGGWGGYRYSGPDLKMGAYNEPNYTFDKLKAGSYEITVFDEENVSYTETVVVNEPEELRVSVMSDGSDCSGNGSAKLTITGGTPMTGNLYESYNVEKADTIMYGNEPLFENLRPDLYSFVTLDANGCKAAASFSIKDVSLKVVVDDWHYPTSSTSCDGWIRALASQGAGNYSYMWKHVESGNVVGTDSIAVNLSPGTYWLEVSDGNCIASLQKILSSFDSRNLTIEELHRESGPDMNNGSVLLSCSDAIDSLSLAVIFNDSIVPYDSLKFVMENDGRSVRLSSLSPGYYSVACRNALSQGVEIAGFVIPKYVSMELRMLSLHHQKTKRYLNGEAKFLLDGGVAPYNVTLNGEDVVMSGANIVLSNLKADTYSLVVEDSCHVTISRDFEIKAPNDLHFLYEVDSLTCFKSRDGRINLTPYGGWGDYQFSVNGNPFTNRQKYSNMLAGSYTIEVVDCYGATYWDSIYVHQPDSIEVVSIRQDSVSCRGLYDGSVAINVKGGNGVYSIQRDVDGDVWRRGLLYRNLPAMAGYLFNVRDYKGCRIDSIMQDVYEPAPMLLSPDVTHTTCGLNNGAISVNVSGGSFPYSYAWRENGNPMFERSNNISNLLQYGEYELTVVDYHECSERQSFRIDRSSLPYINRVQTDSVSCFGYNDGMAWVDSADVVYAYPKADYKLLWHDGQVGMSAGGLSQGDWSVRILDDNGCMTESPFRISQPTPLTIEKRLQRDALCYGYNDGALAVSPKGGNGGYTFSWSNGMNTPEADSLAAGSYTVLIKDVKNCEASESYVISEPEKLLVDAGEDVTICPGGSYTFIVPGYASYEWKNSRGEVVSTDDRVKVSEEDTYSLSVTDVIGCYAYDDVRLRIGNDALKANFSMTSTATTCDTIAAVEMSNMTLDSLRWEYPSPEFERHPELESEAYVM
ncbi:MAG: SprB repeat-containing protein, partial [Marinilabiliaceae bacterium]|nr:SprB repeat-containing protein [Marinilabiliaceae bacterium]